MQTILLLTNILLLLLWVRVWVDADQEFYFNPLLSAPTRWTDRLFDFLRPVVGRLPTRGVALLVMLFLLAFRGAVATRFGTGWRIEVGTAFGRSNPQDPTWLESILFSGVDFLAFLTRAWGVPLFVALVGTTRRHDRATQAMRFFTVPFSQLPRLPLFLSVVLLNALLVLVMQHAGEPLEVLQQGFRALNVPLDWRQPFVTMLHLGWLTALAMTDILLVVSNLMLALVLVSLMAALTQNRGLQQLCSDGISVLLGSFGRRPVVVGFFDLSPFIFFFVLKLIHTGAVALVRMMVGLMPWPLEAG